MPYESFDYLFYGLVLGDEKFVVKIFLEFFFFLIVIVETPICHYSFAGKTNHKIFQKNQTTLLWGHFGSIFAQIWAKYIFLEEGAQSVFKYSNYLPLCKKSEETGNSFLRKNFELTDGQTDRQTDKQTDTHTGNGSFIGRDPNRTLE